MIKRYRDTLVAHLTIKFNRRNTIEDNVGLSLKRIRTIARKGQSRTEIFFMAHTGNHHPQVVHHTLSRGYHIGSCVKWNLQMSFDELILSAIRSNLKRRYCVVGVMGVSEM